MNYSALGLEIGETVEKKQAAYGDSFGKAGKVMGILYPDGISLAQIDDALCVVRILDKLFRIATDRDALGESPYRDIAGYSILGASRADRKGKEVASGKETCKGICKESHAEKIRNAHEIRDEKAVLR